MNLQELKDQLGYVNLSMNLQLNEDNTPTTWLRQWDNPNRVAIVMAVEVFDTIKANPLDDIIHYTTEQKTAKDSGTEYTNHVVATHDIATHIM